MTTTEDVAVASISWDAALLQPKGIVALAVDAPTADTMDWGDGTKDPITGNPMRHVYEVGDRSYNVSVLQGSSVLATAQVLVREGLAPNVTFAPAADNPNWVVATFNDTGPLSRYEVSWSADVVETHIAPAGTVLRKGYKAGTYPIKIRDLDSGRTLFQNVDVVDQSWEPDFTVSKGADANTALVVLSKPAVGGREITIGWGPGIEPTIVPAADAKEGYRATHAYTTPGNYWVQARYSDDPNSGRQIRITIPFAARDKGIGRP